MEQAFVTRAACSVFTSWVNVGYLTDLKGKAAIQLRLGAARSYLMTV